LLIIEIKACFLFRSWKLGD